MFKRFIMVLVVVIIGVGISLAARYMSAPEARTRVQATPTALIIQPAASMAAAPYVPAGSTPGAALAGNVMPALGAPVRAATRVPAAAPRLIASTGTLRASGSLISASQANLAFQTAGRVIELRVKEGDRVQTGAIMIVLDASALQAQVQQAQAALDLAKAGFDKVKQGPTTNDVAVAKAAVDTAKGNLDQAQAAYDRAGGTSNPFIAMTPQSAALAQATSAYRSAVAQYEITTSHPTATEVRQAQAQVDQAQAGLELARRNLANAVLTAPFEGTVITLSPKLGEMVAPGTPVATLADLEHMQVRVNVDESSLANVQVEQTVTVAMDALGETRLTGRVSRVGQNGTLNGGIVSVPVTIDIDSTKAPIYPGLSATVQFGKGDE